MDQEDEKGSFRRREQGKLGGEKGSEKVHCMTFMCIWQGSVGATGERRGQRGRLRRFECWAAELRLDPVGTGHP